MIEEDTELPEDLLPLVRWPKRKGSMGGKRTNGESVEVLTPRESAVSSCFDMSARS